MRAIKPIRVSLIVSLLFCVGLCLALNPAWLQSHYLAAPAKLPGTHQTAKTMQVLVELNDLPTSEIYNRTLQSSKLPRKDAQKAATEATQAHQHKLEAEQGRVAGLLKAQFGAVELYRVQRAMNGIAVQVPADKLDEIRKLAGVRAVSVLATEHTMSPTKPTDSTSKSSTNKEDNAGNPPASKSAASEKENVASTSGPEQSTLNQVAQQDVGQELTVTSSARVQRSEQVQFLVELKDPAAARVYGETLKKSSLSHRQARAAAVAAARNSLTTIRSTQQRVGATLRGSRFAARELYRVQRAFNGIAIQISADKLDAIRNLPEVKEVHPLELEFPTTSTSVPFLGTPNVWSNTLGLPSGYTGAGIKIGIIDTGIDYQHANFGGTGLLADYQANDRTTTADGSFPTAKVVGGYDFAGDSYTGNNAPAPDSDPMDCNGHGTHVAGIAAGFGVKSDGTTYTGPYDNSAPFGSLRIGPGTAPKASLYALRVFGCTGGTGLTVQAIDWAIDPNGDNDFSDHLDVINMSLGSDYGTLSNTSTMASEAAALAGVVVVAASGNAGDTYFITSSPANSSRTISVAASADSGIAASGLTINSPAGIAGNYAASASNSFAPTPAPAPSGQTANIVLALDGADAAGPSVTDGCSPLTNAAAVAGNIALIDRGACGFQTKANNAQAAGAIGVIIANNVVGDPYFITLGATGTTPVTIPVIMISLADRNTIISNVPVNATLAAATAADTMASFSSRGPRIDRPNTLKPDITAPGVSITSSQTGVCNSTCLRDATTTNGTFIPGNQALTISGTSMATPHMAGILALMRQEHPDWTVEELKALVMNTALHDLTIGANGGGLKYGPGRVGAGRVDPSLAAQANVIAFNADDAGLVSLSFPGEVVGTQTFVKKLRLVNKGTTAVTYDLNINTIVDAPGVSYSLPGGNSITVPAGGSVTLDVQMNANAALMNHTRDATVTPGQAAPSPLNSLGTLARHWLTEEAGYLNLSISGTTKLRVPLYSSVRPASMMSAPATIPTGGAPTGSTTIPLSGMDVCTGTLGAGPTCTGTFPTTEESLVTPFELQVVSPRNTSISAEADIKYAGVAYNGTVLMFGVASHGDWATPRQVSYNIYIDTNLSGNFTGSTARVLFNSDPGTMGRSLFGNSSAFGQDSFLTGVFNIATNNISTQQFLNRVSSTGVDSAVYNTNTMFLAATPASLGLPSGTTKFKYKVVTCPGSSPLCLSVSGFDLDEANGPYIYDYAAQGLNFNGANLADDLNGGTLPVTWNTANMTTNGSLGALLLHHHNARGKRDEVVVLEGTQTADLAISKSVSPTNPTFGQNATFTVTVNNTGPNNATGVVVTDILPPGLTYVSDDGGGSYSPTTGQWAIGSINNGNSATLHIVATVNTTDPLENTATITSASPLDSNPSNNQATVMLMAPRSADLALQMSVSSPTVLAGGSVTYTLKVTNNGNDPAYSINVPESFSAFPSLTATSFTVSQGVFTPATGIWNFSSLGNGAMATLTYTVTAPNTVGSLTSQATGMANTSDPNTNNNTASATTNVLSPANVTGTKTVAGSFTQGGTVTYTVVLSNSSTYAQFDNPGNEFTDVLPSGLTLVSASATGGAAVATVGTNTVTWNGSIAGNGSVTITITAMVKPGTAAQTISNQGTISYDADGNGTNEASRVTDNPTTGTPNDATAFTVQPSQPVLKAAIGDPFVCINAGGLVSVTATVTNPNVVALDANFTAVLPSSLTGIPGTGLATVNPGDVAVTAGNVTWKGNIPANTTVTITYKTQLAANTPANQPICITSTANFIGGPLATVQECATVMCPTGPVNVPVSDQKAGSLLVFPYYTSKAATQADTRLTLSNVGATTTTVHLFFIDGATCQQSDSFLCLTPNASFSFKASDFDGETTGWLLAVAVDAQGRPIQYNGLIGNAFVKDGDYVDNYGAESFRANSPLVAIVNGSAATLFFDNQSYDAVPNQFAVELQSPIDAAGQKLVTVGLSGDLTASRLSGAAQVGTGLVFNGNEKPFGSFSAWLNGGCQASALVSTTSPRVPNGMNGMIPTGQVGTLKFNVGAGVGLLMTPRTATWKGIRTLHKTGLTATTLTIPIVVPVC